jgi:hypothetical protein
MNKRCCTACNQGWIIHVRVIRSKKEAYVCDECESTWLSVQDIGTDRVLNFEGMMESEGVPGSWNQVEIINGNNS